MIGYPVDFTVGVQHIGLDLLHIDEPGTYRPVDEGAAASPAVGVGVEYLLPLYEFAFGLEPFHDGLVRVFYKESLVVRHIGGKAAFGVYGADDRDACPLEHSGVVLAEARRGMYDSRSVFGRHKVPRINAEGVPLRLPREIREKRFVFEPHKIGAFKLLDNFVFVFIFVIGGKPRLRQDVVFAAVGLVCGQVHGLVRYQRVADVRPYGKGQVRGQGPGRRGPREEIRIGRQRGGVAGGLPPRRGGRARRSAPAGGGSPLLDFKTNCNSGIVDIPVTAQVEFVVAEYRGATGAVRKYVVAFVEQALFPEGFHDPPDGFHVTGVHGFVVVVEVHPAAEAADIIAPFFYIAQYRSPAGFDKFFHAVAFNVGSGVEAEFFFY